MSTPRPYLSPDARRFTLLEAAHRLVETGGIEALTVTAVAKEAGVSRALAYSFFPGNDVLQAALFAQLIDKYQNVLDLVDAESPDSEARVVLLLRTLSELPATDLYILSAVVHANRGDRLMTARRDLEARTKARWSAVIDFDSAPAAVFTVVWLYAGIVLSLAVEVKDGRVLLEGAETLLRTLVSSVRSLLPTIE